MTTDGNDLPLVLSVAVLGGTGKEGSGLAMRWALNGYKVIIGSRDANRANERAGELNTQVGVDLLVGMANVDAAAAANVVVVSVPFDAHRATLESVKNELQGKVVVDICVPMQPPDIRQVYVPPSLSAALEAQEVLGAGAKVVAAFHNVSATKLKNPETPIETDVLICGDDADAKKDVMHLVEAAGMRGIDAGPLANSVAAEALTPVLLYINKTYGVKGAGIRITGL
ncbi:MAG TPA: NADPH-dependent F420 reductase [Phototrophicaceae bacterium]|nr:NADPH-dependent F420 reductase [Phototrophicaceae bacterium]